MTEKLQIYKCDICGNIVEVLHSGIGQLVCCGKPMKLLEEKTEDEGKEKHVPVIEKVSDNKIKVRVGSIRHPMEGNHYIEWIEIITSDEEVFRRFLSPGKLPEAEFDAVDVNKVRIYCNIHGLWEGGR